MSKDIVTKEFPEKAKTFDMVRDPARSNEHTIGGDVSLSKLDIQAIFEHLNLGKLTNIEYLGGGEINKLFRIDREGHSKEILRIAPHTERQGEVLQMTQRVAEMARVMNVRTPRIKFVCKHNGQLGAFSIEEYIDARPVSLNKNPSRVFPLIFSQLNLLHQVRLSGSGPLDSTGSGTFSDWQSSIIRNQENALEGIYGNRIHDVVGTRILECIGRALALTSPYIPNMHRLLHGDVKLQNFLEQSGSVSVIDWEGALSGDPVYDLAYFSLVDDTPGLKNMMKEQCSMGPLNDNFDERYIHYQGTVLLRMMYWSGVQKNYAHLSYFKQKANTIFKDY